MLEGDLGDFSLAEILQLLGFSKKSGRLQLHGPRSAGRMILTDGQLIDLTADVARLGVVRRLLGMGYVRPEPVEEVLRDREVLPTDQQLLSSLVERGDLDQELAEDVGRNHALESLAELLRWSEGSFRFDADKDAAAGIAHGLSLSTEQLMEQARERLAGWDELAQRIGPGDQPVTLVSPVPPRDVTIPAAAWGVLMFVDGRRTVDELATLTGRGAYDTRLALAELLDHELVALGSDGGSGPASLAEAITRIAELEAVHHPGALVQDAASAFGAASDQDEDLTLPAELSGDLAPPPPPSEEDVVEEEDETVEAVELATVEGDEDGSGEGPSGLRTKVRGDRLRTDPSIDEDLVSRLIDGVEEM